MDLEGLGPLHLRLPDHRRHLRITGLDNATGKVVAVNNTGNEDGGRCTDNNPCEVAEDGTVTVREGINYGQQTYRIPACFALDNKLDLSRSGCALPKP